MSSSDLMHIYGFKSVQRELNGGNPGPYGKEPGYSDCLANATGAPHQSGTVAVSSTVTIYRTKSGARKEFVYEKRNYPHSKSGIGNGLLYEQGYFILWQGRNIVEDNVITPSGSGYGSLKQTVELASKTSYHFAHPVADPKPPKPPKGDPAPDPCGISNKTLEKQLKRVGIKVTLIHQRQFSDLPDFPWQCGYDAGPLGVYYVNTVSGQDLKREGYKGTVTQLMQQNAKEQDSTEYKLKNHPNGSAGSFGPHATAGQPDVDILFVGAVLNGVERTHGVDESWGCIVEQFSENHIPHKYVQKLKDLLKSDVDRFEPYLDPQDFQKLKQEARDDASRAGLGLQVGLAFARGIAGG